MKKIALFLLILVMIISSLSAKAELWMDFGISSGRTYASDTLKMTLRDKNIYSVPDPSNSDYGGYYINSLGPYINLIFFPFDSFRLGLNAGAATNFTIGIKDGGSVGYDFRHFDFRQDFKVGISYYQMFSSSMGMFTDIDFNYSFYRLGEDPSKNHVTQPDFLIFKQFSISADLGLIQKFNNWFFKFGFLFNKNLFNEDNSGWSLDVMASGGYIF